MFTRMSESRETASVIRARITYSAYDGTAIAARIATIATVTMTSISVNPCVRRIVLSQFETQCMKPFGVPDARPTNGA